MIGSNFLYFLGQGFRYFWSNKFVSLAAVGVLSACLFIMGNFWLIYKNIDLNLQIIESENETVMFIDDEVDEAGIRKIENDILKIGNIDTCIFKSKAEAFDEYKANYSEDADLLADLEATGVNPLRASFVLSMKDLKLYDETMYQLEQVEGVARIRERKDTVDGVLQVAKTVYFVSYWIMGLLFIASLFIIVNTIKIARFVNRKQINIMKLVGATDWFVRWPFIYEGAIIGISAAIISFGFEWYAYTYVVENLASSIKIMTIMPFTDVVGTIFVAFLGCGLAVGVIGSTISIRKYLDV